MSRPHWSNDPGRPGWSTVQNQNITQTVYHPRINDSYDSDGIMTLFDQDDIDWDDYNWDTHPWVQGTGVDPATLPTWDDMSDDEQDDWWEDNGQDYERFTRPQVAYGQWVEAQGTAPNGDIDYSWYNNDPLYLMAFDALGYSTEERNNYDNLQQATIFLTETYQAVMSGAYQLGDNDWDQDVPEPWEPKELDTSDVYTAPEAPKLVKGLPSPKMPGSLRKIRDRSGSNMEQQFNNLKGS